MGKPQLEMGSEKFSLKWNDFHQSASNSFRALRKDQDFLDVTLVSDDEVQFQGHKLVLSACSQVFKNILKKAPNPHPLIFLSGIKSRNLHSIMDYIYLGEVELYQDQLDEFLNIAQKLQVEGLNEEIEEEIPAKNRKSEYSHENERYIFKHNEKHDENGEGDMYAESNFSQTKITKMELSLSTTDTAELDQKLEENIGDTDGLPSCKICGKIAKNKKKSDLRKHIETHFDGLSFSCQYCDKTFRTRSTLQPHISRMHKL